MLQLAELVEATLRGATTKRDRSAPPRQEQRRLTSVEIEQLVAQYVAGASMQALAAQWRLHHTTVAGHLRRRGVTLRRQGVPEDRVAEAVSLYAEGWSCQRLAERFGCDGETVRQVLRRAGVALREPWERIG